MEKNASRTINGRLQRRISLEWMIVTGRRRITSGHRTIGGEEEDRNNHGGTK